MKRLLLIAALIATMFVPGSPAEAAELDDEAQFVALINNLRTGQGLAPLAVHNELISPSRVWAQQLSNNGSLSHATDLSVGVSVYWTKLGENVGVAAQDQVQQLFDAFVASPAHYENLVDPAFQYVGIGVVYDGQGRMWTTHRFMALGETQVTAPPTTAPPTTAPPTTQTPVTAPPTTASPTTTPPSTTAPTAPTTVPPELLAFRDAPPLNTGATGQILMWLEESGV